jgi:transcriptional regulator with XRE-family HTH domain
LTDWDAGQRLKKAIHVARAQANILYDTELAVRAGVSYDTLMNWYGGKTVPRGAELRRVGQVLGVTYSDLMAAYEGLYVETPELTTALRELTEKLSELVDQLRRGEEDEARLRAAEAELRQLRARAGAPGSDARSAPHEITE